MENMKFGSTEVEMITIHGEPWVMASTLGKALGYADPKAVQRIYTRNRDEFSESMTGVVNLTTPSGSQDVRVFSLRGSHLVAIFARTPKAKSFRRWILDILDALHRGAEYVRQKRDEAERLLEDRRQQASSDGKGLSSWRWDKQPLQMSFEYWKERQQLCLEFL